MRLGLQLLVLLLLASPARSETGPRSRDTYVGTVIAQYRFAPRDPRLGPPPPWTVPDSFRRAVAPAVVVEVEGRGRNPGIPFALRVSASDVKPAPHGPEPAPVYHWSRGSVYATLDAAPSHGRLLRVLAKVRLARLFDGRTRRSPARFWVRVDGSDPSAVPLVQVDSENEITAGWREISIDVPVFPEAEHVHFGLDVRAGAADIAEVRIVDLGPSGVAPPVPLTDLEVDRLVVLARLLGYVRFFYPSDPAAEADWNAFSIDAVQTVLDASTPAGSAEASLESVLRSIFAPIAPTLFIGGRAAGNGGGADPDLLIPGLSPRPDDAFEVVRWNHYGLGMIPGDPPYHSERVRAPLPAESLRDPVSGTRLPTRYETTLRSGALEIPVVLPLVLYSGVDGTLPMAEPLPPDIRRFRRKPYGFLPVSEDRTTRLAGVMTVWNVAQHFYPNFDEIECDWPAVLPWALREAATATDRDTFIQALERMLVPLQDGHAGVYPFYDSDSGRLPFELDLIDGNAWVTGVDPALRWNRSTGSSIGAPGASADGRARAGIPIAVGDELVAIDGTPVATLLVSLGDRVSAATAGSHQVRTRERLLRGRIGEARRCTFSRQGTGQTYTLTLELAPAEATSLRIAESHHPRIADLGHGVLYLDAARIDDAAFAGSLPALVAARGIVVDCRGYPGGLTPRWLEHWLLRPAKSPQWHVPVDHAPDRTARTYTVRDWRVTPETPRITAPTVFLTDATAISRAETYLSIVRHAAIGQIVGGPTAGTNGNILPIILPNGLRVTLTGMKVRTQDGAPFHGIGIVPDLAAAPTVRGIQSGKDEVLEVGLSLLRSGF